MLQQYGRVPQLGWNLYALSPQASFDYVLFPFIAVSKSEFAIVGRARRRGKKMKLQTQFKILPYIMNSYNGH